jgi:hypothetical protein
VKHHAITAILGWFGVAVGALALVVFALDVSGVGPFDALNRPISPAQADRLLAGLPPPALTPSVPAPSRTESVSASETVVATGGGSVGVSCAGSAVKLEYASPDPGYAYKLLTGGDGGPTLTIAITSGRTLIEVEAYCANGTPVVRID